MEQAGNIALQAKFNEGLGIIRVSGEYEEIHKKWFGVYEEQPLTFSRVVNYLIWIILPLLGLAIAGFLWLWTLKKQVGLRTIAFHKELAERRRTEEALQESEARFRNLLENIPSVAVQGFGMDGTTQYWNQASEKLYGYTAQEAIGRNLLDLLIPDDLRDDFTNAMQHAAETAEPISASELTLRRKDGSNVLVYSSHAVVKKPGSPPEWFCFDIDITERKRMEVAANEARMKLQEAVRAANVGLWDWDLATNRVHFSAEWKRQIGYDEHEISDNFAEWEDRVHPDDLAPALEYVRKSIAELNREYRLEFRFRHKDGSYRWILAQGSVIIDDTGKAVRALGSHIDITERKQAEEELRESEERFFRVFENAPIGMALVSIEGKWLKVNRATCELLGYTEYELLTRTFQEITHSDDLATDIANAEQTLAGVISTYRLEKRYIHKQGHLIWVLLSVSLVRDRRGAPNYFISQIVDITERKKAEEALRATNELLSLFIKHSPIYAFIKEVTPTESLTLRASENYQDMIGIPGSAMAGKTMHELFPADFAAKITADDWAVVSRGEILRLDEDLNGRNYTTIKFPILLGEKHLLAGYTIDITERKRVEEELRRRENQLQRILEILPIGLWFADKDGTLLHSNPMGLKIWGVGPNVPISEYGSFKAWRLPSREPVGPNEWALTKTIRSGVTIVDELLEIESFDGKRKTILNYSAPVLDDNGDIDGAILVNLDISDRKALEDQLLQAHKMESVGRLAGGVAHDFNNMLSVILGHTELALYQLEPAQPLYARLQNIREAAQRSANLTRQLLAFARKQTVAPKVLDLNETVEGMLTMLRRLIGEDIDLAWLPGRNLGSVKIDPSQIDQILVNLCVNARDAIGDTGNVTIHTDTAIVDEDYSAAHASLAPGEYVLLTVSDNGVGMDPETLSHLFEPFFTTKETGKGTGLGLAMVYGIVKQNNGFIDVQSEMGQGTTFKMYLPRHAGRVGRPAKIDDIDLALRGVETILLVEDEPMILSMATTMLERLGYSVLPAGTPAEAIRLAGDHADDIQLLMTDVVMPEMNGSDLANKMLSLNPALKLLFMSGYTADVIAHHGVLDEGMHFIQKPFAIRDLAAKVRGALDAGDTLENRQVRTRGTATGAGRFFLTTPLGNLDNKTPVYDSRDSNG